MQNTNEMNIMNNQFEIEDEDDVFLILNERDREYAVEHDLKVAYSDIDLEDSAYNESKNQDVLPTKKNRFCSPELCQDVQCQNIHSLDELVLFPCRDQNLCSRVVYQGEHFLNVREGCFNLHGNEEREDFFIRNRLVNKVPKYVQPIKLCLGHREHGIMFRSRRYVVKPDESLIKTLVCQSIKKSIKCRFGDNCTYAHKYIELKITPCKGRFCSKYKGDEPCPYIHMDESLESFKIRNLFHQYFPNEVQPPLPPSRQVQPPLPPSRQVQPPLPPSRQVQPPLPPSRQFQPPSHHSRQVQAPLHHPVHPQPSYSQMYNPQYKTQLCSNIDDCRFGSRCNFAHSFQELRK
jgi:hypothetical protein